MIRHRFRACSIWCVTTVAAAMTACSGGSSSSVSPVKPPSSPSPSAGMQSKANATATIYVPFEPQASAASRRRGRNYVPPKTAGLIIVVKQQTSAGTSIYSTTGYALNTALSPASSSNTDCIEISSAQMYKCSIVLNVPPTTVLNPPPATSPTKDLFFLYEYDQAQKIGTIDNPPMLGEQPYIPSGDLLGEDEGSDGKGDPIPSSAFPNGIPVDATTALSFTIRPVAAMPNPVSGNQTASPLILSVTGSLDPTPIYSGQPIPTNSPIAVSFNVDGYDAQKNNIANYITKSGDATFVNNITTAFSPGYGVDSFQVSINGFVYLSNPVITNVGQQVTLEYVSTGGDRRNATKGVAASGVLTLTSSFVGGFNGTSDFPVVAQKVEVAPLFVFASPLPEDPVTGDTQLDVFAVQADIPTGGSLANYKVAIDENSSENCGISALTQGQDPLVGAERVEYVATIPYDPSASASPFCVFKATDGFSTAVGSVTLPAPVPTAMPTPTESPGAEAIGVNLKSSAKPISARSYESRRGDK